MAAPQPSCNPTPHHHHHHHHHHHQRFFFFHSQPLPFRTPLSINPCSISSSSTSLTSNTPNALQQECDASGQAASIERLWLQFFSDPSQWWDKRLDKEEADAPDFKHKASNKELWIKGRFTPPWLQAKLVTLTQQAPHHSSSSSSFSSSPSTYTISFAQESVKTEQLWEDFFSHPSLWWDHRSDKKKNPRFPDFKHKTAKKALWVDNRSNPHWIHAKLAAMVQSQEQAQSSFLTPAIYGKVVRTEQLWQEFFSDSSQWWDNRFIKTSPKYPDFKHKSKHFGLWIDGWMNPPWVKAKIASLSVGDIQSGGGLRSWLPNSFCNGDNMNDLCEEGRLKEALHLVELMVQHNTQAPNDAYVALMKGCGRRKALVEGKQVHNLMIQSGRDTDIFLGNTLVEMYAKCGSVLDARNAFDKMPDRNVFSWTAIISAYADHEQGEEAINLFRQMQQTGILPDKVACVVVLKACASIAALEQGKQIHSHAVKSGFELDVFVGSALVDMYAKCSCLEHAIQVFNNMHEKNLVSWNAMLTGYAQQGLGKEALTLFEQMKHEDMQPNNVTYVVLLKACASIRAFEQGKQLHSQIIKSGFELDGILGSALVDMYAKCGSIPHARQVFNDMHERDVVSWNAMITGYAQQGLDNEAHALYVQMNEQGVQPNDVTYAVLLKACASSATLEQGKHLHSDIVRSGFKLDVFVGSALVDMYAKCGSLEHASHVFNNMYERDVVSWNAMIAGYAQKGLGKEALTLLEQMQREGTEPDDATYVSILSACSRSGLVDEGRHHFNCMSKDHGVTPNMDHYACIVDLLARAGCLADAEDFISNMPIQPDVVVWRTLLAAARTHGHVEIGKRAFDCVMELKPGDAAAYVLLANIYAAADRSDDLAKIQKDIKDVKVNPLTGCSWIETDNHMPALVVGNEIHP